VADFKQRNVYSGTQCSATVLHQDLQVPGGVRTDGMSSTASFALEPVSWAEHELRRSAPRTRVVPQTTAVPVHTRPDRWYNLHAKNNSATLCWHPDFGDILSDLCKTSTGIRSVVDQAVILIFAPL